MAVFTPEPVYLLPRPQPASCPVLPSVDLGTGAVLLVVAGRTQRWRCERPGELAAALARAVVRPVWNERNRALTVTVAATGRRGGRELEFRLT